MMFSEIDWLCLVSQNQIYLAFALNVLGLTLRPGFLRILLTVPPLGYLVLVSYWRERGLYFGDEYMVNMLLLTLILTHIDWVILANPDREKWRRLRKNVNNLGFEEKVPEPPQKLLARAWWAIRLRSCLRYIGWSPQVHNSPPAVETGYPRWKFLIRKILRAGLMFLIQDTCAAYTASTIHGAYRGEENGKIVQGLAGVSWSRAFVLCWIYITMTYSAFELLNCLFTIVYVTLGLALPEECPPLFGDLRGTYTVRRTWGQVWHHLMRRNCTFVGVFIARDICHFPKGSFLSKYTQLFTGFLVSALVHSGAAALYHKSWRDNGDFVFIMAQAVVILVEDHVILLGQRLGFRDGVRWRLVGFAWCVVWFGLSPLGGMGGAIKEGMWIHARSVDVFGIGPPRL